MSAIKKSSPPILRLIIIAAVVLGIIGVIIYGLKKSVQSNEQPIRLQGQIVVDSTNISAKVAGRIATILVEEGQTVQVGQPLIEMDSPEVTAQMDEAQAALDAAQSALDKVENGARPEEIGQAQAALKGQQAAAALAQSTYERINRLYSEGLMARQKRDEAYTKYLAEQEKLEASKLQYDLAVEGAREEDKRVAQAQVAQVEAKKAQAQVAQDESNLKSPVTGIVDNVIVNPGEIVGQGVPIMTLINLEDQWVAINVTEDQLNQFNIGAEFVGELPALSTPDAPYRMTFKVFNTSALSDFATWRATNNQDEFDVRTFEVKARPLEPNKNVRSGMSVLVSPNGAAVDNSTSNNSISNKSTINDGTLNNSTLNDGAMVSNEATTVNDSVSNTSTTSPVAQ